MTDTIRRPVACPICEDHRVTIRVEARRSTSEFFTDGIGKSRREIPREIVEAEWMERCPNECILPHPRRYADQHDFLERIDSEIADETTDRMIDEREIL